MKIICIDCNYPATAAGAEHDAGPLWFLRPDTALLRNNDPLYIPRFTRGVTGGCGLVVRIDRVGKCIDERFASRYYREVTLAVGFAAADLLAADAARGLPWERATAFDHSFAIAPRFVAPAEAGDTGRLRFTLEVNGAVCQEGFTGDMLRPVDRLIACVSQYLTLRTGDLLFTGSPAPPVALRPGDTLRAALEGETLLDFDIR